MAQREEKQAVKMAETSAPQTMQRSYKNYFTPNAIFFLSPTTFSNIRDWVDCFNMKASAVFFAIFDLQANDKTLNAAVFLLKSIARICDNLNKGEADATLDVELESMVQLFHTQIADLPQNIMITIDAIYLVMCFLQDIKKGADDAKNEREKLDKYFMSRYGTHVLSDIAKLDNQLPLDLLINVVQNLPQAVIKIPTLLRNSRTLSSALDEQNWKSIEKFNLSFKIDNFHEVISIFSWYYSPFYADIKIFQLPKNDLLNNKTLFECLHHCLVQSRGTDVSDKSLSTTQVWPIPTAKELQWAGVQFEAKTNRPLAVKFTAPSLKLAVLFFDSKLETVAMNLLALESQRLTRPFTRYYQMMNELVDDVRDVRVLKKFGVVRGWKREDDVVSFFKMVDGFASYPSMYPSLDLVMEEVKKFHDAKMNRFLGRFRPDNSWVPYVAAAIVILSTTAIIIAKREI